MPELWHRSTAQVPTSTKRDIDTPRISGLVSVRRAELREQQRRREVRGVDVTVPDADRGAGAAGVAAAGAHASPPAPAGLAPPTAALSSAVPRVLPSERLVRLAELAAAAVDPESVAVWVGASVLGEQAMADVLAAVDASTAVNTSRAYRSDWARFTGWAAERGFAPLPAPALVVAHYVTEAAAEQTSVGRGRYTPATLSRWVSSINQFHTAAGLDAPGRAEVVRRALSGVRRIRALPPVRRSPLLLADIRTLVTSMGSRPPSGRRGWRPAGTRRCC